MRVSIIAAVAANGVIGSQRTIPWKLSEDLRFFKKQTMGKAVIMGRLTYQSLPVRLIGRKQIVLSNTESSDEVEFVSTRKDALASAKRYSQQHNQDEICIIGGSQIYQLFFDLTNTMYITEVDLQPEGDTLFPEFDRRQWACNKSQKQTSANNIGYRHTTFTRA